MQQLKDFIPLTTNAEKVEYLSELYPAFRVNGRIKTYLATGRESLKINWLDSKGIRQVHNSDFDSFLRRQLFRPGTKNFILDNYDQSCVDAFVYNITCRAFEAKEPITEYRFLNENNQLIVFLKNNKNNYVPAYQTPTNTEGRFTKKEMYDSVKEYFEQTGLMNKIDQRIKAEAQKLQPNYTQINIQGKPTVQLEKRLHKSFEEALQMLILESQMFIAGPAGTGKTTLGEQLAESLSLPFSYISCSAGMSEAHLLGRMDISGNYIYSSFIKMFEEGGVFLFDEVDAADANTMLVINSALANGLVSVPNRKDNPVARRHKGFYCICAANTWGFGSNEYAGRNQLDAAFLDRFCGSKLLVDYDKELEKQLSSEQPMVAAIIWQIRDNVTKNKIRRVVSTRAIVSGVRAVSSGVKLKKYVERFLTGWSDQEKAKALENLQTN